MECVVDGSPRKGDAAIGRRYSRISMRLYMPTAGQEGHGGTPNRDGPSEAIRETFSGPGCVHYNGAAGPYGGVE